MQESNQQINESRITPENAGNGSLNNEEIDKEIFKCVDLENIDTNSPCFKSILVISQNMPQSSNDRLAVIDSSSSIVEHNQGVL